MNEQQPQKPQAETNTMLDDVRNVSMNHHNGDEVRKQWPIGMKVSFKPKGWVSGESLSGIVEGHLYVNLLFIKSGETTWCASTFRCTPA